MVKKDIFCNDFDCIKLMLPPGTIPQKEIDNWVKEKKRKVLYILNKTIDEIN